MKLTITLELPIEGELAAARRLSHWTIAQKAGITAPHVQQIMAGKSGASLEVLRAIGKVLGVDVDPKIREALKEKGL